VLSHAFGSNFVIHFSKGTDAPSIEPRHRVAAIVAAASLIAGTVAAQPPPTSREPIVINSVVATIDDTTNTADFTTISVTQGGARITAEKAHATDAGSKNSRWTFTGRVMITSEQRGSLWANQAIVVYRDGVLDQIVATGAPARFELQSTHSERADHGQADEITYEAKQATVRLRGRPQISTGSGLEMNAPMFLYHVRDGRLQGYSDNGTRAVHIITKPTDSLVP
jgi:lipopolysaccharide transport protein LptA